MVHINIFHLRTSCVNALVDKLYVLESKDLNASQHYSAKPKQSDSYAHTYYTTY